MGVALFTLIMTFSPLAAAQETSQRVSASTAHTSYAAVRMMESSIGNIQARQTTTSDTAARTARRIYVFENGDQFQSVQVQPTGGSTGTILLDTVLLTGENLQVRYYDGTQLKTEKVVSGATYQLDNLYFSTDTMSAVVSRPVCYTDLEYESIELQQQYPATITVVSTARGYSIRFTAPAAPMGSHYEHFTLVGKGQLIDWSRSTAATEWGAFQLRDKNRWTYRGYYYKAPSNYLPSGDQVYYRIPVSYIPIKMLACEDPAAQELAIPMLDVMTELQNEAGYFPTHAGSEWLMNAYQIAPGFYDTRFSTDMALGLLTAYEKYGISEFLTAAQAYGDYFLDYTEKNHRVCVDQKSGEEGWLVEDYHSPDGNLPVHTSLNHQLSECYFLFRLEQATGNAAYGERAEQMTAGLTILGTRWIKPDGNLWYSISPNGTFGGVEYPYLTYNDLFDLQNMLQIRSGARNPILQQLMDSKLIWMQKNGITGYKR